MVLLRETVRQRADYFLSLPT
ncbi:hypothetical protein MTR67_012186 [Solanum verrucosum]|uniref:Uncharacterized protein n=1 Tax=Solanum verrucosum TaxID=315347 RepID=A0AAF0TGS1_SOLVR|nr:hypothetical protein MTR67_012186 [Solanum verrucosum]